MRRLAVVFFATVSVAAHAAGAGDVRYVPAIRGRLVGVQAYPPTNVCLRHSGSESTQCAYTDMDGRFRIPSFGGVHPERAGNGDARPPAYADYWLELGTRTKATTRLRRVELVDDGRAVLHLECDLARKAPAEPCTTGNPG
ncbi:MAG: hypothetical protein ACTHK2_11680 [Dokdonella sp.]|uniref:hypothetical protein n=1 Tax=Dokdonella sp. TaxID=2291710 RepID=UPI003F7D6E68